MEHSALLARLGTKALVVTGAHSARANGSLADVEAALRKEGIAYAIYDKVPPNPGIADAREGAAAAIEAHADFVIGIGGGSPLDAAKAIAVLARNQLDDERLFQNAFPNAPLPIAAVPTTAGTGSEVTQYSILTNARLETKTSIASESIFPKVAFLDAAYTASLPLRVTVNTAVDALSHAVEGFLSVKATAFSDGMAISALNLLGAALPKLSGDIGPELRQSLLDASSLAGMVIAQAGTTAGHAMGYSLTFFKDIDHGRANGLTMAAYLEFLADQNEPKLSRLLAALGIPHLGALKELLDSLLGEREGVSLAEIKKYASISIKAKNIGNAPKKMAEGDLVAIYRASMKIV
jgi:alcohol dehydrogenase class IV